MTTHHARKTRSITKRATVPAIAAPRVLARRRTPMAIAGPALSNGHRRKLQRMLAEKHDAFARAYVAMTTETMRANQALATSLIRSYWSPLLGGTSLLTQVQGAALNAVANGLTPLRRKVAANGKRFSRTRSRRAGRRRK